MKHCMITFRSVTPAQRAEGLLRRAGIWCLLGRTPRYMEEQGCGYSLRVRQKDVSAAVQMLQENHITLRRVYGMQEDGKPGEVLYDLSG